jgi:hypothetical protein
MTYLPLHHKNVPLTYVIEEHLTGKLIQHVHFSAGMNIKKNVDNSFCKVV